MKTLYSSTFLSLILAFLALLGNSGMPIMVVQKGSTPSFQTIIEPVGPSLPQSALGKVKVEVFNTFDCEACNAFGQGALPELVKNYTDNKDVELHLYLVPDKGKEGELFAVRGAYCASKYNRFWDMVYKLYQTDDLSSRAVDLAGQELDFPVKEFRNCIGSEESDVKINEGIAYSVSRKVGQKPTILVNDTILLGAQPIENIERIIKKYLNNQP